MAFSGRRIAARKILSVDGCRTVKPDCSVKVYCERNSVRGERNGRLPDRGKLGRVVRSGCDHRRRTVGLRPLVRWSACSI
jgi:hypothetical protein